MEVHGRLAGPEESDYRFFLQILIIMIYIKNYNLELDTMSYLIEARVEAGKPRVRIVDELAGECIVEWQHTEHADIKRLFQKLMLVSCLEESRCRVSRESMGMSGEPGEGGRGGSFEVEGCIRPQRPPDHFNVSGGKTKHRQRYRRAGFLSIGMPGTGYRAEDSRASFSPMAAGWRGERNVHRVPVRRGPAVRPGLPPIYFGISRGEDSYSSVTPSAYRFPDGGKLIL